VDPILDQRVGSEPAQDRPGIARALQAGRHAMSPSPMKLSSEQDDQSTSLEPVLRRELSRQQPFRHLKRNLVHRADS
jgi:hypothetical protein